MADATSHVAALATADATSSDSVAYSTFNIKGLSDYSSGGTSETVLPLSMKPVVDSSGVTIAMKDSNGSATTLLSASYSKGNIVFAYAAGKSASDFEGVSFTLTVASSSNTISVNIVPMALDAYVDLSASHSLTIGQHSVEFGLPTVMSEVIVPANDTDARANNPYSDYALVLPVSFGSQPPTDTGLSLNIIGDTSAFATALVRDDDGSLWLRVSAQEAGKEAMITLTSAAKTPESTLGSGDGFSVSATISVKSFSPEPRVSVSSSDSGLRGMVGDDNPAPVTLLFNQYYTSASHDVITTIIEGDSVTLGSVVEPSATSLRGLLRIESYDKKGATKIALHVVSAGETDVSKAISTFEFTINVLEPYPKFRAVPAVNLRQGETSVVPFTISDLYNADDYDVLAVSSDANTVSVVSPVNDVAKTVSVTGVLGGKTGVTLYIVDAGETTTSNAYDSTSFAVTVNNIPPAFGDVGGITLAEFERLKIDLPATGGYSPLYYDIYATSSDVGKATVSEGDFSDPETTIIVEGISAGSTTITAYILTKGEFDISEAVASVPFDVEVTAATPKVLLRGDVYLPTDAKNSKVSYDVSDSYHPFAHKVVAVSSDESVVKIENIVSPEGSGIGSGAGEVLISGTGSEGSATITLYVIPKGESDTSKALSSAKLTVTTTMPTPTIDPISDMTFGNDNTETVPVTTSSYPEQNYNLYVQSSDQNVVWASIDSSEDGSKFVELYRNANNGGTAAITVYIAPRTYYPSGSEISSPSLESSVAQTTFTVTVPPLAPAVEEVSKVYAPLSGPVKIMIKLNQAYRTTDHDILGVSGDESIVSVGEINKYTGSSSYSEGVVTLTGMGFSGSTTVTLYVVPSGDKTVANALSQTAFEVTTVQPALSLAPLEAITLDENGQYSVSNLEIIGDFDSRSHQLIAISANDGIAEAFPPYEPYQNYVYINGISVGTTTVTIYIVPRGATDASSYLASTVVDVSVLESRPRVSYIENIHVPLSSPINVMFSTNGQFDKDDYDIVAVSKDESIVTTGSVFIEEGSGGTGNIVELRGGGTIGTTTVTLYVMPSGETTIENALSEMPFVASTEMPNIAFRPLYDITIDNGEEIYMPIELLGESSYTNYNLIVVSSDPSIVSAKAENIYISYGVDIDIEAKAVGSATITAYLVANGETDIANSILSEKFTVTVDYLAPAIKPVDNTYVGKGLSLDVSYSVNSGYDPSQHSIVAESSDEGVVTVGAIFEPASMAAQDRSGTVTVTGVVGEKTATITLYVVPKNTKDIKNAISTTVFTVTTTVPLTEFDVEQSEFEVAVNRQIEVRLPLTNSVDASDNLKVVVDPTKGSIVEVGDAKLSGDYVYFSLYGSTVGMISIDVNIIDAGTYAIITSTTITVNVLPQPVGIIDYFETVYVPISGMLEMGHGVEGAYDPSQHSIIAVSSDEGVVTVGAIVKPTASYGRGTVDLIGGDSEGTATITLYVVPEGSEAINDALAQAEISVVVETPSVTLQSDYGPFEATVNKDTSIYLRFEEGSLLSTHESFGTIVTYASEDIDVIEVTHDFELSDNAINGGIRGISVGSVEVTVDIVPKGSEDTTNSIASTTFTVNVVEQEQGEVLDESK